MKKLRKVNAILTSTTLEVTFTEDAHTASIQRDHPNFADIIAALNVDDADTVRQYVDIVRTIKSVDGNVEVRGEQVFYGDVEVHGTFVSRLLDVFRNKMNPEPIFNFIQKVMNSPSNTLVRELYDFLEYGRMPLTEDGCFLAYKVVRSDYMDKHSGTVRNAPGDAPRMLRSMVDDRRENTCSHGFHFCSFEYIQYFYSAGDRIVMVKVNPVDVVSIPTDYNNTKARCEGYDVVSDITDDVVKNGSFVVPSYMKA